jgi:hypothetical protein
LVIVVLDVVIFLVTIVVAVVFVVVVIAEKGFHSTVVRHGLLTNVFGSFPSSLDQKENRELLPTFNQFITICESRYCSLNDGQILYHVQSVYL